MSKASPFGDSKRAPANHAQGALQDLKRLAAFTKKMYTWDVAVVTGYDHVAGTVDVRIKLDKKSIDVKGVPIWGRGGSRFRFGWELTKAEFDRIDVTKINNEPDVGMLFHPRLDSTRAFEDFQQKDRAYTDITHGPFSPVFIPGLLIRDQSPTEGVAEVPEIHQAGPNDKAFLLDPQTGAGVIIKSDGTLILRGLEVVSLGLNQTYANAKPVVRQGDTGDGGLGAGPIIGGSAVIKAG